MGKPEIRFKGYTDEWEQRKLGDVLDDMYNGQTPSRNKSEYWNGNIKWLSSGELNRGTVYDSMEMITEDGQKSANLRIVPKGTFIMAITGLEAAGTRGNCALLGFDTTLNQSCMALFPKKDLLTSDFLFQWYRKVGEEYGINYTQGTKQQSYNAELIKILPISLPSVAEQRKIASYLSNLDHLITLHQRKCDEVKSLKKYMLQKMFPQNEQKVPEIRFEGFTEAWEQRKLGDVLERRIEQRQQSEEYPRLAFASGQGVIPLSERKTNNREQLTKDEYTKKYLVTELNDIVYNPANVKYGAIDRNKCRRGLISPIYVTFTTNEIPGFIERIVTSHDFQQRALRFEEGTVTKRQSVNPEDLVTLDILVAPKREEQQKIATYFDSLDHLITLHQQKCEELKKIKKFMLQKMFV